MIEFTREDAVGAGVIASIRIIVATGVDGSQFSFAVSDVLKASDKAINSGNFIQFVVYKDTAEVGHCSCGKVAGKREKSQGEFHLLVLL